MKTIHKLIATLYMATIATAVMAVEPEKPEVVNASLEPYGTISWPSLNGQSELGAGANVVFTLGKTGLSIVGFGEGDHDEGLLVERLGGGLRYTATLGKYFSLDGGISGGYDLEDPHFFIRLPLGANLTFIHTKNVNFGIRAQYAFDISGDNEARTWTKGSQCEPATYTKNEQAAFGRLFAGPVLNVKF